MIHAAAAIAIFVTDAFLAYAGGRWLDEWDRRRLGPTLCWTAAIEAIIGMNFGAFIELGWLLATPIAMTAASLGTALAWKHRKARNKQP